MFQISLNVLQATWRLDLTPLPLQEEENSVRIQEVRFSFIIITKHFFDMIRFVVTLITVKLIESHSAGIGGEKQGEETTSKL